MPLQIEKTNYILESQDTKEKFEDGGWMLDAPNTQKPSLVAISSINFIQDRHITRVFKNNDFILWCLYSKSPAVLILPGRCDKQLRMFTQITLCQGCPTSRHSRYEYYTRVMVTHPVLRLARGHEST